MRLADALRPCGPTLDAEVADRVKAVVDQAADAGGWRPLLEAVWPALSPISSASPYLAGLLRRDPARLHRLLECEPDDHLAALIQAAHATEGELDAVKQRLRRLKAELHLLTALCDLGGLWTLDEVTGALSAFADAAVQAALSATVRAEIARGRMLPGAGTEGGPAPGLFVLALGKHGACELNYSSDIDVTVFYTPDRLPTAPRVDASALALRLTQTLAGVLQERTADGYVFRVDLRLRPDPSSTPAAVPVEAALDYYESVGQNWERAALIKARACAGDFGAAERFLTALQPFVWRRHLDYAAIADIHAIKRQIHAHKVDERATAPGANLKLGRGGIREIEFYVQTQQLILGGRARGLRPRRTLDALAALAEAGHVEPEAASELTEAYRRLRAWEHRVQMLNDEQTHTLPEDDAERTRVAALSGFNTLADFDAAVEAVLARVNARYGALFAEDEDLSSAFGSLVFTGVEDDPETLATLKRMGFRQPASVAAQVRGWHYGRIAATRTERGRELFTRLAPRLLEACQATGAPDAAFTRFGAFFARLSSGVQLQSLFLAEPKLFQLVVEVMAFAPELAATLARQPAALDALLDPGFFQPLTEVGAADPLRAIRDRKLSFEGAMDAVRRAHREQAFRIGVQVMTQTAKAGEAGRAFADLADACLLTLAPAALAEAERVGGGFPGEVAVVALGKFGSREMNARSDLDIMTLYRPSAPGAMSAIKGWAAETFYARFTQRLVAALSAPTAEGGLYPVDLQLRPSGTAGPIAVGLAGFELYHAGEAQTWEHLALTRARVAWASSAGFAGEVQGAIERVLRRPRNPDDTKGDVAAMRNLMTRERPASSFWDLKLSPGGLVDVEFAAQTLQLLHAAQGGPLAMDTAEALARMGGAGRAPAETLEALQDAWRLQQNLVQVLSLSLAKDADPSAEPPRLRAILADAGSQPDFAALTSRLVATRTLARAALEQVLGAGLA